MSHAPPRTHGHFDISEAGGGSIWWGLWAIAPFAILSLRDWPLGPGYTAGDYAQYILHAQAIVDGRPYADTGYIYSMLARAIGPPKYPMGLPLTLAPFVALFGPNLAVLRAVMIASGVAALWVAFVALRRYVGAAPAALGTALAGAFIGSAHATRAVGSDLGFTLLVWILVLLAAGRAFPTWRSALGFMGIAVAALTYRAIGLAAFLALPVHYLLDLRTWSKHLPLRWGVTIGAVGTAAAGAVAYRFLPDIVPSHPSVLLWSIGRALRLYGSVAPKVAGIPSSGNVRYVWGAFAAVAILVGIPAFLRRAGRSYLAALVLAYAGIIVLSPVRETRYLWPIAPVVGTLFAMGVVVMARRFGHRAVVPALGLVMVATAIDVGRTSRAPQPPALLDHPDVQDLFQWMASRRRPPLDRVVFFNPRVLTLRTGLPAMAFPHGQDEQMRAELAEQGITLVILGNLGTDAEMSRRMERMVRGFGPAPAALYANASFSVYAVPGRAPTTVPPPGGPPGGGSPNRDATLASPPAP